MQHSERNFALEIAKGALAVISLPFSLLRRSARSIGARDQSVRCASFDSAKWTTDLLKHLEWRRFEELCTAYFEALGFATTVTRSRLDGGADIALRVEGADKVSMLVHCKAWSAYPIGVKPLQELYAGMAPAGAGEAVLVASGRFTQPAADFAAKHNIKLIDGPRLLAEFANLIPEKALALLKLATKGDFLTPTCPGCSIKMISRKSTGEGRAFWGCENYPRCKQTFSTATLAP
ncbi:MAG: restriction system protein [Betaproteobacteria bacterium]|jgi:restriction system protein|nr:restriction system protein [Betaproteobacteria bacterium]